MKSKLIAIPYTIGIIKPHIAIKEDKVTKATNIQTVYRFKRS